jgi:hypothetical protein
LHDGSRVRRGPRLDPARVRLERSTSWRSDVDADLTGILFTQRAMGSPQSAEVLADFWKAAYAAIDT